MEGIEDLISYASRLRGKLPIEKQELWEEMYKLEPSYKHIEGSVYYKMMKEKFERVYIACKEAKVPKLNKAGWGN